jgi:hypothetical protein
MGYQSRFPLARLIDTWVLRAALLASVLGLLWATWGAGPVARWFVALAGATAMSATIPILGRIGLRRVRFTAGAMTASAGAVLTLQLGFMAQHPAAGDPDGFSGAIAIALLMAALGGWMAEERLERLAILDAQIRDELAAERHAELLAAMEGGIRPREPLRAGDLALATVALLLLRRRGPR